MQIYNRLKFNHLKLESNFLKILALGYFAALFSFLFLQNFVLTDSFEILALRSLDGFSFHVELRKLHEYIIHGEIKKILRDSYFFGYGFIFWIFFALITLPFYLFGTEQQIIITAFEVCLIFQMLCLFVIYKIASIYSKNESTKLLICFLSSLFGVFAFFGLHFYAITPVAFFELLAFYYAARLEGSPSRRDLILIALTLAVAVGIKITGILIMPAICLILADRCKWQINRQNLKNVLIFLSILLIATFIFSRPSFKDYYEYLKTINDYRLYTGSNGGTIANDDISFMFNNGVVKNFLPKAALISLFGLFILRIFYDLKYMAHRNKDFIYILLNCLAALIYCLISVKRDPVILANYLLGFSFLFLLPLTVTQYWNRDKYAAKIIITGFLLTIIISTTYLRYSSRDSLTNPSYVYNLKYISESRINKMLEVKEAIGSYYENNKKISIIYDYQIPMPYSRIRKNVIAINYLDNINVTQNWHDKEFDFVILKKDGIVMQSPNDIVKNQSGKVSSERLNDFLESQKITEKLAKTGEFKKSKYQKLYDGENILIFKRVEDGDKL